jgi:hypothetical protein
VIVRLTREESEAVRRDGRLFVNALGHESAERYGDVVGRTDRYVVVEKTGEAGEIVEALDPRDSGRVL